MIAFENFTPLTGLTGGALIGLSAALFLALNGRIAGISGAFSTVLLPSPDARPKRWFILGLILAAPLWLITMGTPTIVVEQPMWIVVIAGLIVGTLLAWAAAAPVGTESAGYRAYRCAPSSLPYALWRRVCSWWR